MRVGKKLNFSEEQLNELVECVIWQTLLETGKSRAVICKWQQAIIKAWKFDQYNEMGLIMDYIPYSGLDGNSLDSDVKSARIRSSKTVGRHGKVVP